MTLISKNGKIIGCERNDHSLILCQDCMCTDMANCPLSDEILVECKKEKIQLFKPLGNEYERVALEIAKLVTEKQLKYGDSFGQSHRIFEVLYPDGVKPDQMKDFLVVVRVVDKLFRISRGDQGDESAWDDINGYSNLAAVRTRKERS